LCLAATTAAFGGGSEQMSLSLCQKRRKSDSRACLKLLLGLRDLRLSQKRLGQMGKWKV
jgi:hypothetical protein